MPGQGDQHRQFSASTRMQVFQEEGQYATSAYQEPQWLGKNLCDDAAAPPSTTATHAACTANSGTSWACPAHTAGDGSGDAYARKLKRVKARLNTTTDTAVQPAARDPGAPQAVSTMDGSGSAAAHYVREGQVQLAVRR